MVARFCSQEKKTPTLDQFLWPWYLKLDNRLFEYFCLIWRHIEVIPKSKVGSQCKSIVPWLLPSYLILRGGLNASDVREKLFRLFHKSKSTWVPFGLDANFTRLRLSLKLRLNKSRNQVDKSKKIKIINDNGDRTT